jgi:hypothetical protein
LPLSIGAVQPITLRGNDLAVALAEENGCEEI